MPRRHRPRSGSSTSSTSCRPTTVAELLVERRRRRRPSRRSSCLELATIRVADTSFVEQVRALGRRRTSCSTRGSPSWPPSSRAAPPCAGDRVTRRGQPAHRARPRLLHRHRRRDLHGRLRAPEVGRRRRSLRRPRQRRPHDVPGRRRLASASRRTLVPLLADGVLAGSRSVPSAVLVAARRRGVPRRQRRGRRRAAGPRHPVRGGRRAPQKFGKQIRYAERRGIPYVWFTDADGGHEVKDIRSRRAGRRPTRPPGPHPTEDLRPQVVTHDTRRHQ